MGEKFEKKRQRNASGESTISNDSVSHYIPTPPDGGWGWVIVFASFINHIIVDGLAFTFGVFYLEFLDYFKESKGKTALVGSLLCGFYLMAGPFAGALTNKFGCRPVVITGSIIASVGFFLCTYSPNIDVLMITYGVIGGFGLGLVYLPSVIAVSYYFEKRRALATGIAVCGTGVGTFIFAPTGQVLLDIFDWKNAMLIVAAITLNGIVTGLLMRPLEAPKKKKRPRAKNFIDRLNETLLNRKESECSTNNEEQFLEKLQEVKLARQQALREEEGDFRISSLPPSALNSLQRLDRSRTNSIVKKDSIPVSTTTPEIVISDDNEKTALMINGKDDLPLTNGEIDDKKPKKNGKTVSIANGHSNTLPRDLKPNGFPNGSVHQDGPRGSVPDDVLLCANKSPKPYAQLLLPPEDMKHISHSAGDIWTVSKREKRTRPKGVEKSDYAKPLYRKDIFYSGSVLHIPQFQSQPDVRRYVTSITTIPDAADPAEESFCWNRLCIPKTVKDSLQTMLDFSILKDPVFLIACLGNIFGIFGLFVPFVYIAQRAIELGVEDGQAAFLLSVIGITNTIGRVMAGAVADFRCVNPLILHNLGLLLGGIACILNMFCTTYVSMCIFAAFFGFCVATWISLTSIILCNLIGLEKLTNAFGLLTMMRGVASVAGPPVAGYVFELTGNFDASFHVGGVMLILAGLLFCSLHLPYFTHRQKQQEVMEVMSSDDRPVPLPPSSDEEDEEDDVPTEDKRISLVV